MLGMNRGDFSHAQLVEFEKMFPAARLSMTSRWLRRAAWGLGLLLLLVILVVALAPWQQFVPGKGRVVDFSPLRRPQVVQSPISGRVARWIEGIREGLWVEKGQPVVEVLDLDPNYLSRLRNQLNATEQELDAMKRVARAYEDQVEAFRTMRQQVVAAADQYVEMAQQKLQAERQKLEAAEAALAQVEADYLRKKQLAAEGLASVLSLQIAERKQKEALAKVEQAKSYVAAARHELQAKQRERDAKDREALAKLNSSEALLRKASGDVAKKQKDLLDIQVKLTRQTNQVVRAPWSGYLLKLETFQDGALVKQGDPLFTLVPAVKEYAVELWLDGNDVAWVTPGRRVRLLFEGWPGIQGVGWPSLAVNTFGGIVTVVDSADNGKGKFRILVRPDPEDRPWPSDRFLRQGVQANGLVMLEWVPLWYEIWRQLNNFPPVAETQATKEKPAKIPFKVGK